MSLIKLPGLIDVHVHLREPGETHKEDFLTASRAAIVGGFTFLLDMPNNLAPIVSLEALDRKIALSEKALIPIGFHYGTDGKNLGTFGEASRDPKVFGLKIFARSTTGTYGIRDENVLEAIVKAWPDTKPILLHATTDMLELLLALGSTYKKPMHVCHVTTHEDIASIRKAKEQGQRLSAGVTPHHLFLTEADVAKLGPYAAVKPPIETKVDQDALWEALTSGVIDIVESDHAPHTKEEKESGARAYGVPGLETTLGLMLRAVHDGKLAIDDIVRLLHDTPKKLFGIPEQKNTYIECDPDVSYIMGTFGYQTKCGWSPFESWELYGRVQSVVVGGTSLQSGGHLLL